MNTSPRRQQNVPMYHLQTAGLGMVNQETGQKLHCPKCRSILATRIYDIMGYLFWRDGHTNASKLLPFGLSVINEHGIHGPGARWRSCYQLPHGFVSKGKIKNGDFKDMRKFMYDLEETPRPKRPNSIKNAVTDCSMGWESSRYWKIHHLINRNVEHKDLIEEWYRSERTLLQIGAEAASRGMDTGFPFSTHNAEFVRRSVESVNAKFRQMPSGFKVVLTEPELPVAIICPKCTNKSPGQMNFYGAIISVTD